MNILGPDELLFGVDDLEACSRYLLDYGLTRVDTVAGAARFEALDGTARIPEERHRSVAATRDERQIDVARDDLPAWGRCRTPGHRRGADRGSEVHGVPTMARLHASMTWVSPCASGAHSGARIQPSPDLANAPGAPRAAAGEPARCATRHASNSAHTVAHRAVRAGCRAGRAVSMRVWAFARRIVSRASGRSCGRQALRITTRCS